jgi:iron(III) transport system ATP-binding protein
MALARTLVVKAAVLPLDEPLSNLDANVREEVRSEIRRLYDEFRITTLYVMHDQVMVTSDCIILMSKGRIEQTDAPYTVYRRPRTRFVAGFIGRTNFAEGRVAGDAVQFPGFRVPKSALEAHGALADEVLISVRPQSIQLARQRGPGGAGAAACPRGSRCAPISANAGSTRRSWRVQSSGCESPLGRRKFSRWASPCGWMSTSRSLC